VGRLAQNAVSLADSKPMTDDDSQEPAPTSQTTGPVNFENSDDKKIQTNRDYFTGIRSGL
jgi:hypothetical protein